MIPGTVSIGRWSDGTIRIEIRDELSRVKFVSATMSPEAFAHAVTGLAEQDAELEVHGLEYVGKRKVTEKRQIACPLEWRSKDEYTQWLIQNAQEDGWILNTHLGSQDSVTSNEDGKGCVLRYNVYKYVEEP